MPLCFHVSCLGVFHSSPACSSPLGLCVSDSTHECVRLHVCKHKLPPPSPLPTHTCVFVCVCRKWRCVCVCVCVRYCPECRNDVSEVVLAGEKLKESKKKSKMASANSSSQRDWGKVGSHTHTHAHRQLAPLERREGP